MTPLFYEDSLGAKAAETLKDLPSADDELIDDPAALEVAQAAANATDPDTVLAQVGPDWVAVYGPERLGASQMEADQNAALLMMPLDAEGIPYAWDPFPPQEMYVTRGVSRPFALLVAPENAERARALLGTTPPGRPASTSRSNSLGGPPPSSVPNAPKQASGPLRSDGQPSLEQQTVSGFMLAVILVMLLAGLLFGAAQHFHFLTLQRLIP